MKLPPLQPLLLIISLIGAAGLFMGASCNAYDCPAEEVPSARIEVACSDAARESLADGVAPDILLVEYRRGPEDAWRDCYSLFSTKTHVCAPEYEGEEGDDDAYHVAGEVRCFGPAGSNEFRVRQGNLVSEVVVVKVKEGRCGPETERFSVTMDVAD